MKYSTLQRIRSVVVLVAFMGLVAVIDYSNQLAISTKLELFDEGNCTDLERRFQDGMDLFEGGGVYIIFLPDESDTIRAELLYRPLLNCLEQEDERLIQVLKSVDYIQSPRPLSLPYQLVTPIVFPLLSKDIISLVYKKEKNIPKGGFFIEAGSGDAELNSVTLEFEIKYKWHGMLVEPHPKEYHFGLETHRKAYHVRSCLSKKRKPMRVVFSLDHKRVLDETSLNNANGGLTQLQCLPLFSLMKAVDNPVVNLLALNIGGGELDILQTLPWDKVNIEIITVMTMSLDGKSEKAEIRSLLAGQGYKMYDHSTARYMQDVLGRQIFVKDGVMVKYANAQSP